MHVHGSFSDVCGEQETEVTAQATNDAEEQLIREARSAWKLQQLLRKSGVIPLRESLRCCKLLVRLP